ncbi:MAG: 16S rRNA (guanine(966)-N(2))-methyltransferase RsmD [Betaproteobacteria bacterium]|nr:16S rRNA (guanine(966)-N(2))-methyltransferase RsmD [Betaproteobacteria bacterium]
MRAAAFRIIGGQWRGRKINFAPSARLRASGDRVRESLFNCLGQRLDGKACLDLFAGAGALALEAASRGARRVVCVECETDAAGALRRAAEKLSAENIIVRRCRAGDFLTADKDRYDVIFMDPPFADYADDAAWRRLLALAAARLASGGLAYCESDRHFSPAAGWHAARRRRAGAVFWQLLRR